MFLRSNLKKAGLVDHGGRYEGTYAAAFEDHAIVAVAAHCWNGNILVQAPVAVCEVAEVAVQASGRTVRGFIGPWEQAVATRFGLGFADAPTALNSKQVLFALELAELRWPKLLRAEETFCRSPRAEDVDTVAAWGAEYGVEATGLRDTPALRRQARQSAVEAVGSSRDWVLQVKDRIVAKSRFNAWLDDAVQIGGVYTPPSFRGRGYGRAVVAGSLREVARQGVLRAVLFTDQDNLPAQHAYRSLGFERIGDYGIISLRGQDE